MSKIKSRLDTKAVYLGVAAAAALTGMSVSFWRRRAYNGEISSIKFGSRLFIHRSEIDRFVREHTQPRVAKKAVQINAADTSGTEAW